MDLRGPPDLERGPEYDPQKFLAYKGDDEIRAYRDEVRSALDADTNLVDVRSPAEFSGELIAMAGYEQEGAQRAGHIPGAASVPWAQAVKEDGTFKDADDLRQLYTDKGVVEAARTSSPTAGSASARPTPGSCCTSCSARRTSRTTTAPGPSGATWSASRSRRTSRRRRTAEGRLDVATGYRGFRCFGGCLPFVARSQIQVPV